MWGAASTSLFKGEIGNIKIEWKGQKLTYVIELLSCVTKEANPSCYSFSIWKMEQMIVPTSLFKGKKSL